LFFKYDKHALIFSQAADKNNALIGKDTVDHPFSAANETGVQFPGDFSMLLPSGNQGCDPGFGKYLRTCSKSGIFLGYIVDENDYI
jgi:hypothetical protein